MSGPGRGVVATIDGDGSRLVDRACCDARARELGVDGGPLGVRQQNPGPMCELIAHCTLTSADEAFVRALRTGLNVLGAAVQQCTLSWLGFGPDEVPLAPAAAMAGCSSGTVERLALPSPGAYSPCLPWSRAGATSSAGPAGPISIC